MAWRADLDGVSEWGRVILDDAPDDAVVNCRIAMDQDVPEGDDPAMIRNGCSYVWGILVEA
jgi:hypothetical protein